jgi:hypothetical protein
LFHSKTVDVIAGFVLSYARRLPFRDIAAKVGSITLASVNHYLPCLSITASVNHYLLSICYQTLTLHSSLPSFLTFFLPFFLPSCILFYFLPSLLFQETSASTDTLREQLVDNAPFCGKEFVALPQKGRDADEILGKMSCK